MFDIVETSTKSDTAGALLDPSVNMATYGGLALGGVTLAGSAAVGTLMIPGQVLGGLALSGALVTAGAVKNETGSYFPFLGGKDKASTKTAPAAVPASQPAAAVATVTDHSGNDVDIEGL